MYHELGVDKFNSSFGLCESYQAFPATNALVHKVIWWKEYKKTIRNNSGQIYCNPKKKMDNE